MEVPETDPIIAEIRAVREARAARFNYDVRAMFEDLRAMKATSDREYITLPPKPVTPPGHCYACGRSKDTA